MANSKVKKRIGMFGIREPIDNPLITGKYRDVSHYTDQRPMNVLQSVLLPSMFSRDGGKHWYDLNFRPSLWRRILYRLKIITKLQLMLVTFPYLPE